MTPRLGAGRPIEAAAIRLALVQLLLFLPGIGLLAAACINTGRRGAARALLAAAQLLSVSGWMIEVVKDSPMTGALVAAGRLAG